MTSPVVYFAEYPDGPFAAACADRAIRVNVDIPPHAVVAITLELAPEPADRGTGS